MERIYRRDVEPSQFQTDILPLYKRLLGLDKAGQKAASVFFKLINLCDQSEDEDKVRQSLVGSLCEGGWSSHLLCDEVAEVEMDVLNLYTNGVKMEDVRNVPQRRGHYVIYKEDLAFKVPTGVSDNQKKSESYMRWGRCDLGETLTPSRLRTISDRDQKIFDMFGTLVTKAFNGTIDDRNPMEFYQNCLPKLMSDLQHPPTSSKNAQSSPVECSPRLVSPIGNIRMIRKLKGPAETNALVLEGTGLGIDVHFSKDDVIALQLPKLPPEFEAKMETWAERKRMSPGDDVIQRALQHGCLLVPKGFKQKATKLQTLDPRETQWVLTFTKAENIIVKARSENQNLVYLMAKCMYYLYLKPDEGALDEVSSYIMKTAMLFLQEENPEELWGEQYILERLKDLFLKLEVAMDTGIMPQYFIPEINILSDVSYETRMKYKNKLVEINRNLLEHLKQSIPRVNKVLKFEHNLAFLEKMVTGVDEAVSGVTTWSPQSALVMLVNLVTKLTKEHAPTRPSTSTHDQGPNTAQRHASNVRSSYSYTQIPNQPRSHGRFRGPGRKKTSGKSSLNQFLNIAQVMASVFVENTKSPKKDTDEYKDYDYD